jgi:tryptophan synthase alpha chain
MERIEKVFNRLRQRGQTAFIPFSVAGYPDMEKSLEVFLSLTRYGDILEFGFPFSDPTADGPVIQKASYQAINKGMTMDKAFLMVTEIRKRSEIPIVFFSYFNPIRNYGVKRFAARAAECGIDGVLVVDVPLTETQWLKPFTDKEGLAWINLATPTTSEDKLRKMDQQGSGFLYYASVTGVTGARDSLPGDLVARCRKIRQACALPVAVGFGISRPEHAAELKDNVDGVVVGSAIISQIERAGVADVNWLRAMKSALE